ncbi:hypothetical protein BIWAKO_07035 [Bosea sp. BIWAKO-01]|nr:hypothetical protein BIWAKO_07035 [Bosea sp. BIWAKO-01]
MQIGDLDGLGMGIDQLAEFSGFGWVSSPAATASRMASGRAPPPLSRWGW